MRQKYNLGTTDQADKVFPHVGIFDEEFFYLLFSCCYIHGFFSPFSQQGTICISTHLIGTKSTDFKTQGSS